MNTILSKREFINKNPEDLEFVSANIINYESYYECDFYIHDGQDSSGIFGIVRDGELFSSFVEWKTFYNEFKFFYLMYKDVIDKIDKSKIREEIKYFTYKNDDDYEDIYLCRKTFLDHQELCESMINTIIYEDSNMLRSHFSLVTSNVVRIQFSIFKDDHSCYDSNDIDDALYKLEKIHSIVEEFNSVISNILDDE